MQQPIQPQAIPRKHFNPQDHLLENTIYLTHRDDFGWIFIIYSSHHPPSIDEGDWPNEVFPSLFYPIGSFNPGRIDLERLEWINEYGVDFKYPYTPRHENEEYMSDGSKIQRTLEEFRNHKSYRFQLNPDHLRDEALKASGALDPYQDMVVIYGYDHPMDPYRPRHKENYQSYDMTPHLENPIREFFNAEW